MSTTETNLAQADESLVIQFCLEEWESQLQAHPELHNHLEDIDVYVCPRADLINAMRQAPTIAIRQSLYSIFAFRQNLAMVTGRSFI